MALSAQQLAQLQKRSIGAVTIYEVPADHRTIVRDVRLMSRAPVTQSLSLWLERAGLTYYLIYDTAFTAYKRYELEDAFIVLDAGDKLRGDTTDGYGWDIWVSGHEFAVGG